MLGSIKVSKFNRFIHAADQGDNSSLLQGLGGYHPSRKVSELCFQFFFYIGSKPPRVGCQYYLGQRIMFSLCQ